MEAQLHASVTSALRSGTLNGEIYERLALNKVVNRGRGKKSVSTANDFQSVPQMISPVSQPPVRSID
jgi:hypothetical protein